MYRLPPFSYSTTFNGIDIEGQVLWCSINDVEVEITNPYSGIRAGLHTTLWVDSPKLKNLDEKKQLSAKGHRTISDCLVIAYEEADFLFRNKDILYQRISSFESGLAQTIEKLHDLKENLSKRKSEIKLLPQTEYREYLKDHQNETDALEKRIKEMYESIYSGFPEYTVRYGVEKQDMQFVKKYFADQ